MALVIPIVLVGAVLSGILALLYLLGAVVPQWYMVSPSALAFGPQTLCRGTDCDTIPYDTLPTCGRSPSAWKDRELTTEVLVWLSLIPLVVVGFVLGLSVFGKVVLDTTTKFVCLLVASAVGAVLLFVALMVYVGTYHSWLNCGNPYCDILTAGSSGVDCGFGASFIVGILAVFMYIAIMVLLVLRMIRVAVHHWRTLDAIAFGVSLLTFAFTIGCGATNRWLVAAAPNVHFGMFQYCIDKDKCRTYESGFGPVVASSATCQHSTGDFEDRNSAVGAMLIIVCCAFIGLCVLHTLRQLTLLKVPFTPLLRLIITVVVGVSFLIVFISLVLFAATWNSWLRCGESFCSSFSRTTCNLGFAFAMTIIGIVVHLLLFILLLWDLIGCVPEHVRFSEPGHAFGWTRTSTTTHVAASDHHRTTTTTTTTTYSSSTRRRGIDDWVLEPTSGYYWSESRQVYWDKPSDSYYRQDTKTWEPAY